LTDLGAQAPEVICLGETLVDFLPDRLGQRVHEVETWKPCPGGSPSNVAIGLARLGARSAMVGTIGRDEFGEFLRRRLTDEGVGVEHLRLTDEGKTGLVFISLSTDGERSFAFYRTRAAELFLAEPDVDPAFIASARALHFGSNSLLWENAQAAAQRAVDSARRAGRIVSCDPNLRLHLWSNPAQLQALLGRLLPQCNVVKLAEDEIEFVTGHREPEAAVAALQEKGVALPVVTLGPQGALFGWRGGAFRVSAPRAKVLDSTGAGDGFMAGLLYGLTRLCDGSAALERLEVEPLLRSATFACAVGSRVVEKLGAVAGLPRRAEVQDLLPPAL